MSTATLRARPGSWHPFAKLYDPDADGEPESHEEHLRRNPEIEYDTDGGPAHSYPLVLSNKGYTRYREKRRETKNECFYCGCELTRQTGHNLDHVLPRSRGGGEWPANIVLTCLECNNQKGDATPQEWLEEIRAEISKLTDQAERLQELINEHGLDDFQPTRSRAEAARATKEEFARTANADQFQKNRQKFQIIDSETGKPILRNLALNEAVHYLENVPLESKVDLVSLTQFYREGLGLNRPAFLDKTNAD
jgi:hypothetical protein